MPPWCASAKPDSLRADLPQPLDLLVGRLAAHDLGTSRPGHGPTQIKRTIKGEKPSLRRRLRARKELHLGSPEKKVSVSNLISAKETSCANGLSGFQN
jgi:hypothetical protein